MVKCISVNNRKEASILKKILKSLLTILLSLFLIVVGYFVYVFIAYHRIDDNISLTISNDGTPQNEITTNTTYRITSSNAGFGAYSDNYSFFMDGGTKSWALSKESVYENINGTVESCKSVNPDFYLFQEIDLDATRTYHVNEENIIIDYLAENQINNLSYTFAVNFDSPFLMYPLYQPHGKSLAGLMTISSTEITDSTRRQLPIEDGYTKYIDLDRCYSKNYINVDNGKQLVLYNVHLSAYTSNPDTATNQVKMILDDMQAELDSGNYTILGGDMNKDLLGDSSEYFGVAGDFNWAKPFPTNLLSDSFALVKPIDPENPIPSCRNADKPYSEDSFVLTVDGFIISSNIELVESNVINTEFKYSDHNPVYMDFILK